MFFKGRMPFKLWAGKVGKNILIWRISRTLVHIEIKAQNKAQKGSKTNAQTIY